MNTRMVILIAFITSAIAAGCSHRPRVYQDYSTGSDYIGNGKFEVSVSGAPSPNLRSQFYKKAYEICAEKNKGFETSHVEVTYSGGQVTGSKGRWFFGTYVTRQKREPVVANMVGQVECKGAIDPEFAQAY